MALAKNGLTRRVHGLAWALPFLALTGLVEPGGAETSPSGETPLPKVRPSLVQVAEAVPLPRLNPQRAIAASASDPIGALVTGSAHDPAAAAIEDSDAPQVDTPEVVVTKPDPIVVASATRSSLSDAGLRVALKMLDDGDPSAATIAAYAFPDKVDTKIIDWLVAISGHEKVPSSHIAGVTAKLADWPGHSLLQIRFEQALMREKPGAKAVIAALGGRQPVSDDGMLLLARSYMAVGRKSDAAKLIAPFWRDENCSDSFEATIRKEFASVLTSADHKARMDRLLYAERSTQALRAAALLSKDQQTLANAVVAVIKGSKASKALATVPASLRKEPIFLYASIQEARRAKRFTEAATLMLSAPRDPALVRDGDAWWIERRVLSREILAKGDAKTAYLIAAGHAAESSPLKAEAEFHAGWYALEFLRDPATARKHFLAIQAASTMPLSQSRAEYWLGRAAWAAGNKTEATAQFRRASAFPTTFYGQLSLARLGYKTLPINPPPKPSAAVQSTFASRELVQAIIRLSAANRGDRNEIFYKALAETLEDPAELALLAGMAEKSGQHQLALQVGKWAAYRGLPVDSIAFPTAAIPTIKTSAIEKPVVYAIARQESAFNHTAISSAGARGLLQLMPATAKQTAKRAGLPYSKDRLTSDPAYNATLGAAYLGELFGRLGGSYVMTFAAYNAGKSRVDAWVEANGDPRNPKVDVVNWIELIPFTETRNYVQRTIENLQVYRARLGSSALTIESDLKGRKAN
jgi:soluble lytic murein transglycosylase